MNKYEINKNTLAIIPISLKVSRVVEVENEFMINMTPIEIIDHSCRFFGSSYRGRADGTKSILGYNYKAPIYVEEVMDIIFFPTESYKSTTCCWISYNQIKEIYSKNSISCVKFKNGYELFTDISEYCLKNQYVRSIILQDRMKKRRKIS